MRSKISIIAEAGVNHNGKLSRALKMVDAAAKAKVDYIKFQLFIPENLTQKNMSLANYQKENSNFSNQLVMLKKYALTYNQFKKIKERCKKRKIKFMLSIFDQESVKFIKKLKLNIIKIASGEITNVPLLKEIGVLKKIVILSTGMSNMSEIRKAIKILTNSGTNKNDIHVLHCNTEYPANAEKLNLMSIKYMKDKLGLKVGFSDHSLGNSASIAALSLGSLIFEKHFTLNKKLIGPDHKASLSTKELIEYVKQLRITEKSIGNYTKKPYKQELKNLNIVRKQIVAKKKISKYEKFSVDNITTKRAIKGISASDWNKVIGKRSKFNFTIDQNIRLK